MKGEAISVNGNENRVNDDIVTDSVVNVSEHHEETVDDSARTEDNVPEELANDLINDNTSEIGLSESTVPDTNDDTEKAGFLDKYSKKTLVVACSLVALLLGILIGRLSQPKGKLDSVLVTESASAEDSGKEYTQIVTIMDNAKHVVEERYYKPDGSPAVCETGYSLCESPMIRMEILSGQPTLTRMINRFLLKSWDIPT